MMQTDPIVAEIREIRERLAARFGFDIYAIGKDAQARDAAGDREVVRLPPRRPVRLPPKSASGEGDVPESALVELADELFRSYDAGEDSCAARSPKSTNGNQ